MPETTPPAKKLELEDLEQQLSTESTINLQRIWDTVESGIFVLDVVSDGEFRYAAFNPAMGRTSPIPVENLLGKTLTEALPTEMAILYCQYFSKCVRLGQTNFFEEQFSVDDVGSWWSLSVAPLRDDTLRIYQLVVTATNISIRKQAQAQLLEQEQFLRSIFDGTENPIFIIDVLENGDFRLGGRNAAAERATGRKSQDLIGKTPEEWLGDIAGAAVRQRLTDCLSRRSTNYL